MTRTPPAEVVITGIGLVTPLGCDPAEILAAIRQGRNAFRAPSRFDATPFSCRSCAEVKDLDAEGILGDPKTLRLMNQDAVFAAVAARLAIRDAGLQIGTHVTSERTALYGATGLAGIPLNEVAPLIVHSAGADGRFDPRRFGAEALNRVRPTLSFKILSNMPICFVSIFEHLMGPNAVYNPWEAQGAQAILAGWEAIRTGEADAALVGGCEVKAHELAFISLEQQGVFAPWKEHGVGGVPGEGAAFLVLERADVARRRGARIYARLEAGMTGAVVSPSPLPSPPAGGEGGGEGQGSLADRFLARFPGVLPADGAYSVWVAADNGNPDIGVRAEPFRQALGRKVGERLAPKAHLGDLFAAAAAVQVAIGALACHGVATAEPVMVECFDHGTEHGVFVLRPEGDGKTRNVPRVILGAEGNSGNVPRGRPAGEGPERIAPGVPPGGEPIREVAAGFEATGPLTPVVLTGGEQRADQDRVVITGLGTVSPLGNDQNTFWTHLTGGVSGTGPLTAFDASGLPVRIGAEVRGLDLSGLETRFPAVRGERDRKVWLGLAAADEAVRDAGLAGAGARSRWNQASLHVGVSLEVFFLEDVTPMARQALQAGALSQGVLQNAGAPLQTPLDRLTTLLGDHWGIAGGRHTNCSACAAGAMVIGEALRRLRSGVTDLALAGAADSMLNPLGVGGFSLLRALSQNHAHPEAACRPFDADRDGTVLGEGAAFLVLETLPAARSRGARIHAELLGYGASLDAYRVSDPEPGGRGAILSMQRALADAGLTPDRVDAVSAHGTGTPKNDVVETIALKAVLGSRAKEIPVHAVKSMTGHMIAASGSLEAAVAALTLARQIVPPTINLVTPDPDCDLDYVPGHARPFHGRVVLSNSFAFGGQNATLIFGAYSEGGSPP